jgi:GNAT superfamily N-acetyltransferase
MSSVEVRPFRRSDRDQLTDLVNAHAAAVIPGLSVSVAAMLSHLERQPGEYIVDPWVSERLTLVAGQRQRIAAAAHLIRYADHERVSQAYRNAGEISWLLFWPEGPRISSPYWADASQAAEKLISACVGQLEEWGVSRQYSGGDLPVPGVYGVPEQWPHVRALYERAGFRHDGHTELVFLGVVDDLRRPEDPPVPGLRIRRSVGLNGTRFSAVLADEVVGYIEVEIFDDGERRARRSGWADVGNLCVAQAYRRRGVATWLLGRAAEWLRLAHVDRLLDYTYLEGRDETGQGYDEGRAFLQASPFTELTRTQRGWSRGSGEAKGP